jgi:hypothetical protein
MLNYMTILAELVRSRKETKLMLMYLLTCFLKELRKTAINLVVTDLGVSRKSDPRIPECKALLLSCL